MCHELGNLKRWSCYTNFAFAYFNRTFLYFAVVNFWGLLHHLKENVLLFLLQKTILTYLLPNCPQTLLFNRCPFHFGGGGGSVPEARCQLHRELVVKSLCTPVFKQFLSKGFTNTHRIFTVDVESSWLSNGMEFDIATIFMLKWLHNSDWHLFPHFLLMNFSKWIQAYISQ